MSKENMYSDDKQEDTPAESEQQAEFQRDGNHLSLKYSISVVEPLPEGFVVEPGDKVTFGGVTLDIPPSVKAVLKIVEESSSVAAAFQSQAEAAALRWAYKNNQPLKINPAKGYSGCVQAVIERLCFDRTPIVKEFGLEGNTPTDSKPLGDTPVGVLLVAEFFDDVAGVPTPEGFNSHLMFYSISILPMIPNYKTLTVDYDFDRTLTLLLDGDIAENLAKTHAFLDNPPFATKKENDA